MKLRRTYGLVLFAVVFMIHTLAFLPGCSRSREEIPSTSIRLGIQSSTICALPLIAAEKDFFRKQGVNVDIKHYPSGKLALMGMFDGEVDMAAVADMPIMSNSFKRNDFAVFGQIAWTGQGAWIIARKDAGIQEPQDLKGKRVATQRNSAVHFFLSMFLLKHGIAEDDVDLVFMKAIELPTALSGGRIDAFSMRNPFIDDAKKMIGDQALEMIDSKVYRQTFNLVAWKEYLKTNSPATEQFLKALAEAEHLAIANEAEAVNAAVAQFGAGREKEVRAGWDNFRFSLTLGQELIVTLEDQARWAIAQKPELGPGIPNYFRLVDTGPMVAVKPEAVSVIR